MKSNKTLIYIVILVIVAVLLAVGLSFLNQNNNNEHGKYDTLAQCLKDKGVTFYGAFWCPHCAEQKKLFGNSAKLLPYQECSTPNAQSQLSICKDKKIDSYPTWEFPDGTRVNQTLTPEELAARSGCTFPYATSTAITFE